MREQISVCRKVNEKLYVLKDEIMETDLNVERLELFVFYNETRYVVQGHCYQQYIVIN